MSVFVYQCLALQTGGRSKAAWTRRIALSQRPWEVADIGSGPVPAVKQRAAWLVLRWVTVWEHLVLCSVPTVGLEVVLP